MISAQGLIDELALAGVTIEVDGPPSSAALTPIALTVRVYADRLAGLPDAPPVDGISPYAAFRALFGPIVIHIYPDRYTLDGTLHAMHCGWEGLQERGCQIPAIHPARTFPPDAWLIVFAGEALASPDSLWSVHLVAHELAHSLTWGEGPYAAGEGAFDYVFYAGQPFVMTHAEAFGVQMGAYAYETEAARADHRFWRQELTADAIASWALNDLQGPHAGSVGGYLDDFMRCVTQNRPDC
ncbi:MAG: hypothetical protein Kow00124_00060 [Anaerolineae bacterium]